MCFQFDCTIYGLIIHDNTMQYELQKANEPTSAHTVQDDTCHIDNRYDCRALSVLSSHQRSDQQCNEGMLVQLNERHDPPLLCDDQRVLCIVGSRHLVSHRHAILKPVLNGDWMVVQQAATVLRIRTITRSDGVLQ